MPANPDLDKAIALHKKGDIAGAIRGYKRALKKTPDHPGALNLLGLAYTQHGAAATALPLLKQALALRPDLPGANFNLATVLRGLERHEEAVTHFTAALANDPRDVEAHFGLALALLALKRNAEAIAHLRTVLALYPNHAAAQFNLARALVAEKDFTAAVSFFRSVLAHDPKLLAAYAGLAEALRAQSLYAEALKVCEQAIALAPDNTDALINLGAALSDVKRLDEAIEYQEKALALGADTAELHFNLASNHYGCDHYGKAQEHFKRAIALGLSPEDECKSELLIGWIDQMYGRLEEAERISEAIISAHGDDEFGVEARHQKAAMYLSRGDFAKGWPFYEYRYGGQAPNVRESLYPRWDGTPTAGPLWVWGEQGLGDEILYAGMIEDLRKLSPSIIFEVEPRLVTLFQRSFPQVRVVASGSDLSGQPIAAQISVGSLGGHLRLKWDDFPKREQGYLVADRERVGALRARLDTDRRRVIGLSWRSSNPLRGGNKSARLSDFAAVLRLPGTRFVDLQYGDTTEERAEVERLTGVRVERLDDIDNTNDIEGLAALMNACDVVVTVSNTNAHLAGALGRPTWVFAPFGFAKLWYWFVGKKQSPWYPRVSVQHRVEGQSWAELISLSCPEIADRLGTYSGVS